MWNRRNILTALSSIPFVGVAAKAAAKNEVHTPPHILSTILDEDIVKQLSAAETNPPYGYLRLVYYAHQPTINEISVATPAYEVFDGKRFVSVMSPEGIAVMNRMNLENRLMRETVETMWKTLQRVTTTRGI